MAWLSLVLRVLHILTGVFWAGTSFFVVLLLQPFAERNGSEGERFLGRLFTEGNLTRAFAISGGLTIVLGLGLLAIVSGGFSPGWFASHFGGSITLGAIAAIAAAVLGGISGRTGEQLVALAGSIETGGDPPTPEQLAQIDALRGKLKTFSRTSAVLLLIAVLAMSAARYAG
jgi:uncharacterized membrane protein